MKLRYRPMAIAVWCFMLVFGSSHHVCFSASPADDSLPSETFHYVIKKFGIKAGDAQLEYQGQVVFKGLALVKIIFRAQGFNFFDEETIYADPQTLFPVRVERDLNIFGKKERIVESYDAEHGSVRIVKYKSGKPVDEVVFEKDRPIDNLYCFLFRYRTAGIFKEGEEFLMNLPTQDVRFKIDGKTAVGFYPEADQAWFMESEPRKYRVWFGTGPNKIPLRIDGAVGLAKTAMILTDYVAHKI